ncbi:hypothetical protein J3A83DRAFT_4381687 [Scleroderma citrinum]
MANASHHSSFHVYRVGGLLGDDRVIKADDRTTILYYLKCSRTSTQWQFMLHAGSLTGILVCHVISAYLAHSTLSEAPGPIALNMVTEHRQVQFKQASRGRRSFKGPDDKLYYWKSSSGLLRNEMQCEDSQGVVVATYRVTMMALTKDGELRINPVKGFHYVFDGF